MCIKMDKLKDQNMIKFLNETKEKRDKMMQDIIEKKTSVFNKTKIIYRDEVIKKMICDDESKEIKAKEKIAQVLEQVRLENRYKQPDNFFVDFYVTNTHNKLLNFNYWNIPDVPKKDVEGKNGKNSKETIDFAIKSSNTSKDNCNQNYFNKSSTNNNTINTFNTATVKKSDNINLTNNKMKTIKNSILNTTTFLKIDDSNIEKIDKNDKKDKNYKPTNNNDYNTGNSIEKSNKLQSQFQYTQPNSQPVSREKNQQNSRKSNGTWSSVSPSLIKIKNNNSKEFVKSDGKLSESNSLKRKVYSFFITKADSENLNKNKIEIIKKLTLRPSIGRSNENTLNTQNSQNTPNTQFSHNTRIMTASSKLILNTEESKNLQSSIKNISILKHDNTTNSPKRKVLTREKVVKSYDFINRQSNLNTEMNINAELKVMNLDLNRLSMKKGIKETDRVEIERPQTVKPKKEFAILIKNGIADNIDKWKYRKVYNNNFDTGTFDIPLYTEIADEADLKV